MNTLQTIALSIIIVGTMYLCYTEVKKISKFLIQTLKNNDSIVFDKSQW